MEKLNVGLKGNEYDILIGTDLLKHADEYIKNVYSGNRVVIISDENVFSIYGENFIKTMEKGGFTCYYLVLKAGEETKSMDNYFKVLQFMADNGLTRNELAIALGGGVIGDLTGFASSSYMRGIKFVQIPTTLLSQVDSSVGGKTAINLPQGKNLVGSFYQPKLVLIDTNTLKTLPSREFASGMAEVIKYGVLYSKDFFNTLLNTDNAMDIIDKIVHTCCDMKRNVVQQDEKDTGLRGLLNLGHTFGHTIEKLGDFTKYTHGEAVAMGMVLASLYGEMMNLTEKGTAEKVYDICKKYDLPVDEKLEPTKMAKLFKLDKKAESSDINLILVKEIGECFMKKTPLASFEKDMERLEEIVKNF